MAPLVRIVRSWFVLAGAQVSSSLIAMVVMVLVSRSLGDIEFGRLYLALTLTTIVGVVVDLGLSQLAVRVVAQEPALARPYLRRAAVLVGTLGTLLYLALLSSLQALGYTPEVRSLVLIVGLLMIVDGFYQLLSGIFQAHQRMLIQGLTRVGGNAIILALVIPLLLGGHGATAVALVFLLAACIRVAVLVLAVGRLDGLRMPAAPPPGWGGLVWAGSPFLATQSLNLVVAKIQIPILGRLAGEATVGWYAAASRLTEIFVFVPLVMTVATFPVLSGLWVRDRAEFHATVRKTLHLLLVMTVPAMVVLFVLADDLVAFLFTLESYGPAVPVLRIQAIALALVFVDHLLVCVLMAIGRERVWLAIVGAACLVNPALNWILIPAANASYANGAIGAALATLLTEIFIMATTLRALPSATFDAESLKFVARTGALGAVLGAVLLGSRMIGVPWMFAAFVGAGAYLVAAIRLGLVAPDIITWARGLVVRRRPPVAAPQVTTDNGGAVVRVWSERRIVAMPPDTAPGPGPRPRLCSRGPVGAGTSDTIETNGR